MTGLNLIFLGVGMFTFVVSSLVLAILFAKSKLVKSGSVDILINGDKSKSLNVPVGGKLLNVLADNKIFVSSACGGGGTCGQCRVKVFEGGGQILPTELAHISRAEAREGYRLSCQLGVKQNLSIEVPAEIFEKKKWECTVRSNRNVATFIKELVLELPAGETVNFRAGGYIQIEAPPSHIKFSDFEIDEKYRGDWDKYNMWKYEAGWVEPVVRAYSMANYPDENRIIMLNVRIAAPPPKAPASVPPGKMSSWIFSLKEGDKVSILGPFGEFFAKETNQEMIFVGGGAGMAPMRSMIFDQLRRLNSKRKISYWYGARSLREMFYMEDFEKLAREFPNFSLHVALSEPLPEDNWTGLKGFIHQVLFDEYLKNHPAPEDAEYYLCGPPMMISAVTKMLDNLGVESENIMYDDFGG